MTGIEVARMVATKRAAHYVRIVNMGDVFEEGPDGARKPGSVFRYEVKPFHEMSEEQLERDHEEGLRPETPVTAWVVLDTFTASAIARVYDALNETNKATMERMDITDMADAAFTVLSKVNKTAQA